MSDDQNAEWAKHLWDNVAQRLRIYEDTHPEAQHYNIFDLEVHQSMLATKPVQTDIPRRKHVKRWFHTVVYHRRRQAQLNAEFGFVTRFDPAVFFINPQVLREERKPDGFHLVPTGAKPYLYMHPSLWPLFVKAKADISLRADFVNNHFNY
jgi:hypothetical protein